MEQKEGQHMDHLVWPPSISQPAAQVRGDPQEQQWLEAPSGAGAGSHQVLPCQGPSHCTGDCDQAIRQVHGDGWAKAQLRRGPVGGHGSSGPMVRQGGGELETSPSAVLLRQGLMAPGRG